MAGKAIILFQKGLKKGIFGTADIFPRFPRFPRFTRFPRFPKD